MVIRFVGAPQLRADERRSIGERPAPKQTRDIINDIITW
jgi:hypothetical protein